MVAKLTKRVLFIGIPDMAYVCLDGLLNAGVNIVGVMGPKKSHGTYVQFKEFAQSRGMNYIDWDNLKDEQLLEYLKTLNLDVAVVASFNYKIPKELLDVPKAGIINIHPSLLPKYRGGNPYSTAIINGDEETGVTLHFMDEGFDTGDIITQKVVKISPMETMGTLFNRLNLIGMQMMCGVLNQFEKGDLPRYKQPNGVFQEAKSIKEQDLYIDYTKPASEVDRFIRALNPFLIASTSFRGNLIKVFMTEVIDEDASKFKAGTIAYVDENKFYIATGKGFISPTAIQFGSYFVGNSHDFVRILSPKVGEVFE